MMPIRSFTAILLMSVLFSSCQFKCQVGNVEEEPVAKEQGANKPVMKDGAAIYNGITLTQTGVQVKKAYLRYADNGERIPNDNFVDMSRSVEIVIQTGAGWKEEDGKVMLGVSEKIITEKGTVLLDKNDMLAEKYPGGVSTEDARFITLSARVDLEKGSAPTSFTVPFKIWDKKSDAVINGSVTLLTK